MPFGDALDETGHWKPGLTRAALWAMLGGLSFMLGWAGLGGLDQLDVDVNWWFGPFTVGLSIPGFAFSAALAIVVWRSGIVGWRRAAGFAALAMPWFSLGFYVGIQIYDNWGIPDNWSIPYDFSVFLSWFAGFLVAGIWVTTSGVVLLPFLRSRTGIVWPLAASTGFAVLAGGAALINYHAMFEALQFVTASWCAVYAAAFSMALPQARRDSVQGKPTSA